MSVTPSGYALGAASKGDDSWWKEATNNKDWAHNVVRIDYAYVTTNGFDATHRISLTLKL